MFSSANQFVMMFGVLISVVLIVLSLQYVNKLFANDTQEVLVKFILLVFTALVGVWVVDKVIAFKISLLSDSEDKELFDLIKTLILMIFSYYFGTKKQIEK
jgi:Na+/phosphate symporter